MNLKPIGISSINAKKISELIRTELTNIHSLTIIERNQINVILKEQGFLNAVCSDTSCAVEIGRHISANKILIGTVMKMEKNLAITVRIVDVNTAEVTVGEKQNAESMDDTYNAVEQLTQKISTRLGEADNKIKESNAPAASNNYRYYDEYSPSFAAASSILPFWSGSFNPYASSNDLQKFPGIGLFMTLLKSGTLVGGIVYQAKKTSREWDAEAEVDWWGDSKEQEYLDEAEEYGDTSKKLFIAWAGLTCFDMIYSAISVYCYNNRLRESRSDRENNSFAFDICLSPCPNKNISTEKGISISFYYYW